MHIRFTDPTFVPRQLNTKQVIHNTTHTAFIKRHINMCENKI